MYISFLTKCVDVRRAPNEFTVFYLRSMCDSLKRSYIEWIYNANNCRISVWISHSEWNKHTVFTKYNCTEQVFFFKRIIINVIWMWYILSFGLFHHQLFHLRSSMFHVDYLLALLFFTLGRWDIGLYICTQ